MSGTYIPECEMCFSEEHDGLRQVCSDTESQDVMNVCDDCYKNVVCFCDRCEVKVGIVSCILTFLDIKTKFRLCMIATNCIVTQTKKRKKIIPAESAGLDAVIVKIFCPGLRTGAFFFGSAGSLPA